MTVESTTAEIRSSNNRKEKVLVICPGRGTYGKQELGYLRRYHADRQPLIGSFDRLRRAAGQEPVSELDGRERFSVREHSRGDNASPLIYACALADYLSIDPDRYEVVAITGNSMGWYIALACAGALSHDNAMQLINTMGTLMQERLIGGQLIYPLVDENWQAIPGRREQLRELMDGINARSDCQLFTSIELGGMRVFGGNAAALQQLTRLLPPEQERFPMGLHNHAAFHTPLQHPVAETARRQLPPELFSQPALPLVDGRGQLWTPWSSDPALLWDYTLGHQVTEYYDFSKAVEVSVKEFGPDRIIVPGPGTSLGGAVAQSLIQFGWQGLNSKQDFIERQQADPLLLSMGMEQQRRLVTG